MKWALPASDTYFAPLLASDPRGFQIDHLELALGHCKSFRAAIDGGAHIGSWSVEMAKRFDLVMAFEPALDTFGCLRQNTALLGNVIRFHAALGPVSGKAKVIDDPMRQGNTGARFLLPGEGDEQVVALDEFALRDLDFLKLDIEGYEFHALRGAAETIKRCAPVIMIEVKKFRPPRFGLDTESACNLLQSWGYRQVDAARNDRVFVHGA